LTLIGVDLGLQRFVSCIQSLIRDTSFCLYALDNFGCRGSLATRLKARPKHLGISGECRRHGQHRDGKEDSPHDITSIRSVRGVVVDPAVFVLCPAGLS
jgi:hypothetical protein